MSTFAQKLDRSFEGQYYERSLGWLPFRKTLEMKIFIKFIRSIFSQENLYVILAFLILVALAVFTANTAPLWIYQGF
jgi:hypothetical protein